MGRKSGQTYEYDAKVVVARDEARARELANENVGDEGKIWADAQQVTCTVVNMKKEAVVCASFNAG